SRPRCRESGRAATGGGGGATVNPDPQIVAAIANSFALVWPEAILILAACLLFLGGTFRHSRDLWGAAALVALAVAAFAVLAKPPSTSVSRADLYAGPLVLDKLAYYVKVLALASGAILVLFSWNQVAEQWAAEYHACLLLAVGGMGLTGMANELVVLFLAL